jgi:RNA polymerase sigma factor (sigma-70 family)
VGIDAMPLRTQSDRRLVRLVQEGYESAFEEIVRRYRRPLDRFAASIVGGRSEDVTQDSFRKALVALRRADDEIELRPWLYRIVRNTALNDLRDRPPAAAELAEDLMAGGRSAAAVAEERAEVAALTAKLRALPQNQRAALVMRELEGMSHEEIAAALGISGGAARQAIARGRAAVRGGFGALVPLPLLRALAGGGGDAATEAAVGGAGAATASGAGMALFGGGSGAALKVGLATVVLAGGIGAGAAIDHHAAIDHASGSQRADAHAPAPARPKVDRVEPSPSPVPPSPAGAEVGDDHRRAGHDRSESHRRHGSGSKVEHVVEPAVTATPTVVDDPTPQPSEKSGGGPGSGPRSDGGGGPGPSHQSGGGGSGGHSVDDNSGDGGGSGDDHSGHGSGSGGGDDGGSRSGPGSGSSESTSGGQESSGGRGSDDVPEAVVEVPPVETLSAEPSSSGGPGPSSSSGEDGSGSSGGHGSDDGAEISP